MTGRTMLAVATALLAAAGFVSAPPSAQAQQAAPPSTAPATAAAPSSAPSPDYTAADLRAVLNARIAALKAVIDLTPEQEKLWPPVEASIREAARSNAERLAKRRAARPGDFLDILGLVAEGEEARAREIRKFIAAARPLVATLTPAQKRRMPAYLGMTDYSGQPSGALWLFQEEEG